MNKDDAATFLGMSVRSLQRLTSEGLFKPALTGAKGAAVYDATELKQWRDMSEDERHRARDDARQQHSGSLSPMTVMTGKADVTGNGVMTVTRDTPDSRREFAQMIAAAVAAKPALSVADKLTLSLIEASQLSGLSRNHLRQAIEEKKLKARIIGRGWRVKREELERYVKKL
ncbi:MAG: helix-turn-helix domain-containing protein [Acidobacteriota bacterium]|nr:helix-turn-helix domain-containing protein [Acidobacteriota bacterium]